MSRCACRLHGCQTSQSANGKNVSLGMSNTKSIGVPLVRIRLGVRPIFGDERLRTDDRASSAELSCAHLRIGRRQPGKNLRRAATPSRHRPARRRAATMRERRRSMPCQADCRSRGPATPARRRRNAATPRPTPPPPTAGNVDRRDVFDRRGSRTAGQRRRASATERRATARDWHSRRRSAWRPACSWRCCRPSGRARRSGRMKYSTLLLPSMYFSPAPRAFA